MKQRFAYKGYITNIHYISKEKKFRGSLLGIDVAVTFESDTVSGFEAAFHRAVDGYLADCRAQGKEPQRWDRPKKE